MSHWHAPTAQQNLIPPPSPHLPMPHHVSRHFRRYITGVNRSILGMNKAVWPLVLMHHIGAVGMAVTGLSMGDDCPRNLGMRLIFGLLGTTGLFHLMMNPLVDTPVFHDTKLFFCFQTFTLSSMVWFRLIYWWKLCYEIMVVTWPLGMGTIALSVTSLLIFTAFNFDFVKFHTKLWQAAYRRMGAKKSD